MTINDFEAWASLVSKLIDELSSQQYPSMGVNKLRQAVSNHDGLPSALKPLYTVCDGISLADVYNGYFIDSADRVVSAAKRGEPTLVEGKQSIAIQVFGSDGGGNRFALGINDFAVYYLPSSGAVINGTFVEDDVTNVCRMAGSLIEFLWLLKDDIEAFVHGNENHHYIGRCV